MEHGIYMDHAATSMDQPPCVAAAVAEAIAGFGNPERGAYEASLLAARTMFQARLAVSALFHAEGPECTAFSLNSTQALNTAILGTAQAGDSLITTVCEHNSVLRPAYAAEKRGVKLVIAGADPEGRIDFDALEAAAGAEADRLAAARRGNPGSAGKLILAVTHGSNLTGNVTDLARAAGLHRRYDALWIMDASQTAGVLPIDMQQYGIDIVCFTGHKALMGPQGTGGLVVRRGIDVRPLLSGGSGIGTFRKEMPEDMPERLEAGTQNAQGIAGLLAALRYAEGKRETFLANENALRVQLLAGIARLNEAAGGDPERTIRVYGAQQDSPHLAIVPFNIGSMDSGRIADLLATEYGIAVRAGGHCAPLMHWHFHTETQGMVRVSLSHSNTAEEVETLLGALAEITAE